jgi:hypothetical protein
VAGVGHGGLVGPRERERRARRKRVLGCLHAVCIGHSRSDDLFSFPISATASSDTASHLSSALVACKASCRSVSRTRAAGSAGLPRVASPFIST